jgi:hypothetical protein
MGMRVVRVMKWRAVSPNISRVSPVSSVSELSDEYVLLSAAAGFAAFVEML